MDSMAELLQPIPGATPVGTYLRYDPVYDKIKEARREEADLPQGDFQVARKTADWPQVIRLSTEALSRKTKDLQIAVWLTEAWLRREGIAGLRQGLELIHELLQKYWDDVYPPIEDGDAEMRAAPLGWLGLKLDVAVRMAPINEAGHSGVDYNGAKALPTREQGEQDEQLAAARQQAVEQGRVLIEDFEEAFRKTSKAWYKALVEDTDGCLSVLGELTGYCDQQFGDVSPAFSSLRNVLDEFRRTANQLLARKLELEPDGPGQAAPAAGVSAPPPTASAHGAATPAGAPAAAPAGGDPAAWIAAAAARLRAERPLDPAAYLLLRGFRWGELRAGGDRVDPRLLAAPSTDTRTRLKGLLLDAKWSELLEAAETVMAQPFGRGWLDLQRYVLTACDALGREYFAVGNAIRSELRALLRDLPALTRLTLMDDSPTANSETLTWLGDQQLLPDGSEPQAARTAAAPAPGGRDVFDVAQDRLRAGDAQTAMQLLMNAANQEKSARARFIRRAQAANIMVGANLEAVALPMLRELLEQADAHRLDDWEAGEMIADPLALLYQCALRAGTDDVDLAALYTRVCRLDPMAAIRLGSGLSGSANESE